MDGEGASIGATLSELRAAAFVTGFISNPSGISPKIASVHPAMASTPPRSVITFFMIVFCLNPLLVRIAKAAPAVASVITAHNQ